MLDLSEQVEIYTDDREEEFEINYNFCCKAPQMNFVVYSKSTRTVFNPYPTYDVVVRNISLDEDTDWANRRIKTFFDNKYDNRPAWDKFCSIVAADAYHLYEGQLWQLIDSTEKLNEFIDILVKYNITSTFVYAFTTLWNTDVSERVVDPTAFLYGVFTKSVDAKSYLLLSKVCELCSEMCTGDTLGRLVELCGDTFEHRELRHHRAGWPSMAADWLLRGAKLDKITTDIGRNNLKLVSGDTMIKVYADKPDPGHVFATWLLLISPRDHADFHAEHISLYRKYTTAMMSLSFTEEWVSGTFAKKFLEDNMDFDLDSVITVSRIFRADNSVWLSLYCTHNRVDSLGTDKLEEMLCTYLDTHMGSHSCIALLVELLGGLASDVVKNIIKNYTDNNELDKVGAIIGMNNGTGQIMCGICHVNPRDRVFKCGHTYCKVCVSKIFQTSGYCAHCRQRVVTATKFFLQ